MRARVGKLGATTVGLVQCVGRELIKAAITRAGIRRRQGVLILLAVQPFGHQPERAAR